MRLVGATASGWLADRIGRKKPLMISIAWYSVCNLIAGLSPTFWFLFLFRALLGIGMGAEWPVGAALAMETWPQRLARLYGRRAASVLGARRSAVERSPMRLLYDSIGWRGLLIIGVLPALLVVYIRRYVKEPEVWVEEPCDPARAEPRSSDAIVQHLQAGSARQHDECVLVDGERLRHRLLDRRHVPDLSAEGPGAEPRAGRPADHAAEPAVLRLRLHLGLGRRIASAGAGR